MTMFLHIGRPKGLNDLGVTLPALPEMKRQVEIAIIDDEPFVRLESLRAHGFHISELGGDIRRVDQVSAYPIVVCDIRGVGAAFGSKFDGAHVLGEIRKTYPDKWLVAYTGMTHNIAYNERLRVVDVMMPKEAPIESWTTALENALGAVVDPRQRWIRFRARLLERGAELYDVLDIEQAFIASIKTRNPALFSNRVRGLPQSNDWKKLATEFAAVATVQLIEMLLKQ